MHDKMDKNKKNGGKKVHNMGFAQARGAKNIQVCYGTRYRKDLNAFTQFIIYTVHIWHQLKQTKSH